MGQQEEVKKLDEPSPLEEHLNVVRDAVKAWLEHQSKKQSVRGADPKMNLLNMTFTGIVNPEQTQEPPYPDALDVYHRMKMLSFQFWDGGLDNQPAILIYEMQIVDNLINSYEKRGGSQQISQLLEAMAHGK